MSAHVLLNLLKELKKIDKMLCKLFISIIQEHECYILFIIYDIINITLKSHFWRKKVIILSLCSHHCYGRHNVSWKSVNHWWFIDFIAWHFLHPGATSYDNKFNPFTLKGIPHSYQMEQSNSIIRVSGWHLFHFYSNFDIIVCEHTVETLIRCGILPCLIWVCTICLCPTKGR